jgi:hypothetical protein
MAAKKKSSKKPATSVSVTNLNYHGLTKAQLAAIDTKLIKAGKKPLSLLIKFLEKSEKSIPNLRKIIAGHVSRYG